MKDYSKHYKPEELEPFFPNEFLRHVLAILTLIIGLLLGGIFLPESSQDALHHGEGAIEEKPLWYLLPIYELSRLVLDKDAFFAILGCATATFVSLPFWDRVKEKKLWKRPVFFPIVIVCLVIILTLGILGRIL